jgi:sarcosine oxidase subunit delta
MRLPCPNCGDRDHGEFVYRGDATPTRPDPAAPGAAAAFHAYVHLRANPAGWHFEHWYHEGGCRSWIVVERNTVTHDVRGARLARLPADEGADGDNRKKPVTRRRKSGPADVPTGDGA